MTTTFELTPVTARIGAVVEGPDLREPISDELRQRIRSALNEHLVLFFRGQSLTPQQQLA